MVKKITAIGFLSLMGVLLAWLMTSDSAANRDVVCYWASGRLLWQGVNAYSPAPVLALEKSVGWSESEPLVNRMTPFSLPLLAPIGLLTYRAAAVVWMLLVLAALMISVRLLWIQNGKPPSRLHLVAYCFAPAMACILAGQAAMFLLLGIAAFLHFAKQNRSFCAGMCLSLCALKPQLFAPLGIVLLLRFRQERRTLAGLFTGALALAAAATLLRPACWIEYMRFIRQDDLQDKLIPTLSFCFRWLVHKEAAWLQLVPLLVGLVLAGLYYARHAATWDWSRHGVRLMPLCFLVTPYAWFTDEVVLLPSILFSLYRCDRSSSFWAFGVIGGAAVLELFAGVPLFSPWYLWTPIAWAVWCWTTTSETRSRVSQPALLSDAAAQFPA